MRLLVYADPHWSTYSSILREKGKVYSRRLENLIESINFVEEQATMLSVDSVICLGDFFDKSELNSQEITALQEIKWANCNHLFLTGNHEIGVNTGFFSSTKIFNLCPNVTVIDKPECYMTENCQLCFLPYTQEYKPLKEYFGEKNTARIIFSHNDIKGIQMGKFVSQTGFDLEDIQYQSNYFINGHLHNFSQHCSLINLGNITGQNFGEDGFRYPHRAMIIDTNTLVYTYINNPYAINFYKIEDINLINKVINAVITVKCKENDLVRCKDLIRANNHNIITSRITVEYDHNNSVNSNSEELSIDHFAEFKKYMLEKYGQDEILIEELEEISK